MVKQKEKKTHWFRSRIPTRQDLESNKYLRYLAPFLSRYELWHWSRRGVAIGAAIGVFFGLIVPIFQSVFAIILAIFFRGNVAVAAGATFISNPFTVPPILFIAYKLGKIILGLPVRYAPNFEKPPHSNFSLDYSSFSAFYDSVISSLSLFGFPLLVGLFVLAVLSSILTYLLINYSWIFIVRHKRGKNLKNRINKKTAQI